MGIRIWRSGGSGAEVDQGTQSDSKDLQVEMDKMEKDEEKKTATAHAVSTLQRGW